MGDSNTICFDVNSSTGEIGSSCSSNVDCLYGLCSNSTSTCIAPSKTCQSSIPDTVCSGHGTCTYIGTSGNSMQNCTIVNQYCTAKCACDIGYGSLDCSLDPTAMSERTAARSNMCAALLNVTAVVEKSAQLFDSMARSLMTGMSGLRVYQG
jgi:hypothetical protein